ncbi:IclR family transcriptional regulator [Paenibacillus albiflavus]|uniref:Glycerol operon regulatory protein n=1 Tax=Paenibacillus albiflavus TaxID=2545760 RepID=A0A4R4EBD2_9BACL|nr:IclR family transcriptional regulator [Paenibacillus albiflavus]TCZ77186.1 IclR family transcriptional regulator [Paenibacillus albiflavus]
MRSILTSVQKSCTLLKLFLNAEKELGVSDLSRKLQISKGAVHKLLITLESEGFIKQNPNNKLYSLGYTLLELGTKVKDNHDWAEFAKPSIQKLADYTKELACFCIIDGQDAMYIDKIESQYPIRFNVEAYRRFPLYATSASRVILAYCSPEMIDQVLSQPFKQYTPYSITDPEEMKQRLAKIRQLGYEISSNLRNIGVTGIAAPIFDAEGKVAASISLIGPTDRMTQNLDHWADTVVQTTQKLSRHFGYKL